VLAEDLIMHGSYKKIPKELKYTLFLNQLHLNWDQGTRSYRSSGKIGIGSIDGVQINKQVDGFVQIVKKRSGDLFNIFLKIDNQKWYYFGYTRGVLHTLSSNLEYVNSIQELKPKDRKMKVKGNETSYIYLIASEEKFRWALRRFKTTQEFEEEPDFDF
ncbi:MAG: hypothetical protein ACOCWG_03195, partial [bacterium]